MTTRYIVRPEVGTVTYDDEKQEIHTVVQSTSSVIESRILRLADKREYFMHKLKGGK